MAITRRGTQIFKLAADAQPSATSVQAGTELINTDDRRKWVNSGTEWIPQEVGNYQKYKVIKQGTTYYVIDQHGKYIGSGSDIQVVLQAVIDGMSIGLLELTFDTGIYNITNPIIIPSCSRVTAQKRVMIKGYPFYTRGGTDKHSTYFHVDPAFPTNRYVIEATNAPGSDTISILEIDGLYVSATDAEATKNVGLVKYQCDVTCNLGFYMNRVTGQYMWRGIHLLGAVWRGVVRNCDLDEERPGFVGDSDIIMEWGNASSNTGPVPKQNTFENIRLAHGDGQMNSNVRIKGGVYNYFNNIEIDGHASTEACYNLDAVDYVNNPLLPVASNYFVNAWTLDFVGTPSPDNRKGAIYLNGIGCFDNRFINGKISKLINHLKVSGGALRNRVELTGIWGGVPIVDSTGAGISNTLEISAGHATAAATPADTVVTDTAGNFRIIDYRRGAEKGGIATARSDGSTIAHDLFAIPTWYFVTGTVAGQIVTATADVTNLTLGIKTAGGAAGTTQSVAWKAGVYA